MKLKRLSEMTPEDWKNLPECRELTPEEKADIYRQYRESFTAADLAEYAQLDEGVLFEDFIADLEAMAQEYHQAKKDNEKPS
jgi:hypothetical protein